MLVKHIFQHLVRFVLLHKVIIKEMAGSLCLWYLSLNSIMERKSEAAKNIFNKKPGYDWNNALRTDDSLVKH